MSWKIKKLGNILSISTGKYDVNHSVMDGQYPFYTCAMLPFKSNTFSFDDEVILLPGNGANVGEVMYFKGKFEAYQRTYVLHKINANVKYLFYYMKGYWKNAILNNQYGSATNYIRLDNITDLQIPLPPLPIQKRIAEILDTADALRRKDQELLRKYDELAQAIFIDMFGDPVKNEKGWEVNMLGDLFYEPVKCGPFGSALKKEEYIKGGVPVWVMDNIQNYDFNENGCLFITEEKYDELKSYSAKNGDIIISRAGTVGKMSVINSKYIKSIISTNLIKISLDESRISPYYFIKLMEYFGKKIGRLRTGSENGFTHMNTGVLAGLTFPLPPIEYQLRFIEVLSNLKNQSKVLSTQPDQLFNSLLQQAFKGELVK